MDATSFIKEIGGGLSAVVIVVQFLALMRLYSQKEALHDKPLSVVTQHGVEAREMHAKTLEAMAALTTATQAANTTAQASLAALERRL